MKLLNLCLHEEEREFAHLRYSAATGDSNDFKQSGIALRQVHYHPPRVAHVDGAREFEG
jgi:chitin synthase